MLYVNGEIVKQIPDFSNYVVSEFGKVYLINPTWLHNSPIQYPESNLKIYYRVKSCLQKRSKDYSALFIGLKNDEGRQTCRTIPWLVYNAFGQQLKGHPNSYSIRYHDNDPYNCHIDNLLIQVRDKAHLKLQPEWIPHIKKMLKNGVPLSIIGLRFGVSDMQIHRIKTGENWNNGRRLIKKPTLPFKVDNPDVRLILYPCEFKKINDPNIRSKFFIRRNGYDGTDNTIIGRINGYRISKPHKNITRARQQVAKINEYFGMV